MGRRAHPSRGLPALVLVAGLLASAPEARAEPGLAAFEGLWVRTEREADDQSREAALLDATASLSFLVRGATRLALRHSIAPPESCEIRVEGRQLTIAREPGPTTEIDLDAPEADASATFAAGELRRVWRHDGDTHGTTLWRLSGDGERLTVRRRLHIRQVGDVTEYETRYVREP